MIYLTMSFLLFFAVLAVFLKDVLLSVLSLATVSALLSILFFQLGCPVAGVFELSVGAGLITVLVVLTISFIQTRKEKRQERKILWALIALAASALVFFLFQTTTRLMLPSTIPPAGWGEVGEVLWKLRAFDLVPQVLVVLSAVFGILALLRREKGEQ